MGSPEVNGWKPCTYDIAFRVTLMDLIVLLSSRLSRYTIKSSYTADEVVCTFDLKHSFAHPVKKVIVHAFVKAVQDKSWFHSVETAQAFLALNIAKLSNGFLLSLVSVHGLLLLWEVVSDFFAVGGSQHVFSWEAFGDLTVYWNPRTWKYSKIFLEERNYWAFWLSCFFKECV